LGLGEGEVLLCEGDEDLDRLLLKEGLGTLEQVKVRAEPVEDALLRESLQRFAVIYTALRERGEDRRFLFTTTATRPRSGRLVEGVDPMRYWDDPPQKEAALPAFRPWLAPTEKEKAQAKTKRKREGLQALEEALIWLDGEAGRWAGFLDRVKWRFGAPRLAEVRSRIGEALQARPDTGDLPLGDVLVDWMISQVMTASSCPEVEERVLTRKGLNEALAGIAGALEEWAGKKAGLSLRRAFEELIPLERLLTPGTDRLPRVHRDHGGRVAPGRLLTAAFEVIPFEEEARAEELKALVDWCHEEPLRQVWLWTGEGGAGKTRLALELCRRMSSAGWEAGFLRSEEERKELEGRLGAILRGTLPRLVVVDYAGTRLHTLKLLLNLVGEEGDQPPKVRVLLLARQEADWWEGLHQEGRKIKSLLQASPRPRQLPALFPDPARQAPAFERAREAFLQEMGSSPEPEQAGPVGSELAPPPYKQALSFHMATLNGVHGGTPDLSGDPLAETLEHERQF